MMGIYDQPKQQEWAAKIAKGDAFILISLNITTVTALRLKMLSIT